MNPSVALCRAQEALELDRAINTLLPNVRAIAERAAIAWGIEAGWAEKRERRHEIKLGMSADRAELGREPSDPSENPDRGLAGAPTPHTPSTH